MWLNNIVFLLTVNICFTFDIPRKCVSDVIINNKHYNISQTIKLDENAIPTDAHYDIHGNLFYVEILRTSDEGYRFNTFVLQAETAAPQKIAGLPEDVSYSIAVDSRKTKVYFGTGKGMYSYDYKSVSAVPLSNSSLKLGMIFVDKNSNTYIIENVDGIEEFYLLDGDIKIRCRSLEALNEMAIDNDNNFYFIREEKLCVLKSMEDNPNCVGDVNYNGNAQISFYDNNVFVASDQLSYFHENNSGNFNFVKNLPGNVTAIAFKLDGEFILGVQGKIVVYKKNYCYFRNVKIGQEN